MAQQVVTGGPTFDYVYSPSGRLAAVKLGGTRVMADLEYGDSAGISETLAIGPSHPWRSFGAND
jgi:hypothetical protein